MLRKENMVAFVISFFVLGLAGCKWPWGSPAEEITSQALKGPNARLLLVNVLSKKLFDDAHIPGSINVDFTDLEKEAQKWDKNKKIVVYCSNYPCTASGSAAMMLTNMGFKDVQAFEGGMALWYQRSQKDPSYKVVGPAKEDYLMVVYEPSKERPFPQVHEISVEELRNLIAS